MKSYLNKWTHLYMKKNNQTGSLKERIQYYKKIIPGDILLYLGGFAGFINDY